MHPENHSCYCSFAYFLNNHLDSTAGHRSFDSDGTTSNFRFNSDGATSNFDCNGTSSHYDSNVHSAFADNILHDHNYRYADKIGDNRSFLGRRNGDVIMHNKQNRLVLL